MKVRLKEKFGFIRDTGTIQNFFGVPFECENKKLNDEKFESVWVADVTAKLGKEMAAAGRVDILDAGKKDEG